MQKTLADFKRDIIIGGTVELIEYLDATTNDTVPEKLRGVRVITHKDTTGFYLRPINDSRNTTRGSFCGYPKASALSYSGDTFVITERYPDDMMGDNAGKIYQRRTYRVLAF